ncbi:lytic transglycosylase domain-containing protein [Luteimonas aquatica]|uniref:lytic transglycosylase domain-containing protein n=1 Tax=Luteimonas aquatica TaxID=450364 RepID=UPI001F59602B|nr:lytic transglycosylase domain-containing protein [Luteimonas aquatica]
MPKSRRLPPIAAPIALLFSAAACAFAAQAQAPASDGALRAAFEASERGQTVDMAPFARDPLLGWLEYVSLRRNIDTLPNAQAQDFLKRYQGQAVGEAFRELWLAGTARRDDWPAFLAAWKPGIKDVKLRCAELDARQATGRADAQWTKDAQALWRSSGKSLPDGCDAPFNVLAAKGGLPPALRWERIDKAAEEWQPAVMRAAARGLPAEEFALANDYAAFFEAVNDRALGWPKTARSRAMASQGLARLAKSTPVAAEAALPRFAQALGFSDAERNRVLYQIALWTVASYEPDAARRLNAVPEAAYDERLHEWRAREAMTRSDWRAALAAINKMGEKQRGDSRWSYFAARLSELAGDKAAAAPLYRAAAAKSDFHGFLAADRLGLPYALCPWDPPVNAAAKAAVARDPALVRALALNRIDRTSWALREWDDALSRFDDTQRRLAVEVAQDDGWFDRAVFGLVNVGGKNYPDESRLYRLRFPLHHGDTIRREAAKNALDPAWVAAEIRAESVFNPRARSGANAMGLMQIVPGTGAGVAKRLGIPYAGANSLYDSDTNITIGSAYLRQMLDKYGQPYFAIAAYNAGPTPVARWQSQRPGMDADFWIETVTYKETREYVARVLAFSVLYDWRMSAAGKGDGDALPLSQRLRGDTRGPRKKFVCAAPTASGG